MQKTHLNFAKNDIASNNQLKKLLTGLRSVNRLNNQFSWFTCLKQTYLLSVLTGD